VNDIDVIATIEADVNDGGWRASGQVFNDNDKLTWYQRFNSWFDLYAGGWSVLPRPAFLGHLLPEKWEKTFQTSVTPFNAFTAQEFMKRGDIQGIFFTDQGSPANKHQIIDMTLAKIFYEIFGGHCNLMRADQAIYDNSLWGGAFSTTTWPEGFMPISFDFINSTAIDSYEIKQGNFWQRLQELADVDFYYTWIGKDSTLHFEPHPMFAPVLPTPVFDLDSAWLAEPLQIENRNTEQVGQVRLSGTTPAGLQIFGNYPSDPTAGPIKTKGNYIGTADTLMSDIAERMYLFENRSHTVGATINSGIGLLVDLMDRITITYTSAADGIIWSAKPFWIHAIKVDVLANFTCRTELTLEAEGDV
jgi:hypothetical protein